MRPHRKSRSLRANGPPRAMTVTSELGPNEPVSDAEIGLVLAQLGDKIAQILESPSPSCSESPVRRRPQDDPLAADPLPAARPGESK